jgi:phosphocarrier protein HPr
MIEKQFIITSPVGFHARPAAVFVKTASHFKSRVVLKTADKEIDAKSMLVVLSLGLKSGQEIVLQINGPDEKEAMDRFIKFFIDELPGL